VSLNQLLQELELKGKTTLLSPGLQHNSEKMD